MEHWDHGNFARERHAGIAARPAFYVGIAFNVRARRFQVCVPRLLVVDLLCQLVLFLVHLPERGQARVKVGGKRNERHSGEDD